MTNELPPLPTDDFLDVRHPEIDGASLLDTVRQRVADRRQADGYDSTRFPTFGNVVYPRKPDDIAYDPDLYHHLHLANKYHGDFDTQPLLTESSATRVPVLGKLWGMIRAQAHNLAIFYTNRAVEQQVTVNRHLVSIVNLLTAENQQQQRHIEALEARLAELENEHKA